MVIRLFFSILLAALAFGSDDDWSKVRAIRSGTELKVYKVGTRQPILAKMDEASEESLIVVVKNEQTAIPKDQIDRIDFRPPQSGGRVKTESTTKTETNQGKPPSPGPQRTPGPSTSVSNNVSLGSKPDFELIYRRRSGAPKQ